jgi:tetraacyldisaccharide 4'-kinase
MSQQSESFEQFAIDVILDRRKGARASALRVVLRGLSFIYRGVVQTRIALYRRRVIRDHHLGCLVVSIGNLTVGGTGKTPVVELFARALSEGGRKVAILSRGYKSQKPPLRERLRARFSGKLLQMPPRVVADGRKVLLDSRYAGDEPYMLARNLGTVPVVVDKDRVKGGLYAIKHFGADTLLLDDGLQYLKLSHRLDVVLVDRTSPFGNERLLPRGTLREPPENLRRASYILITKCDDSSNDELVARIRKFNRVAEIIECRHRPRYLQNLAGDERLPLADLDGKYVSTISGIAVPESFEDGVRGLGAKIELTRRYADHHRYEAAEIEQFIERSLHRDVDMILTTEKDAVRFPALGRTDVPIYFLRVEIEILSGEETWRECVSRICEPRRDLSARRLH